MTAPRLLLLIASTFTAAALTACDGKGGDGSGDDTDTTAGTDDTGGVTEDTIWWDEGCIEVTGAGAGFANLVDAVEVAVDGDTITLCDGTMGETVAITESLNLVGPGADLLTWTAPSNQPAITVSGTNGVTISGFTVVSTRNGIEVANASDVTISDVVFAASGNTGVKAEDADFLTVRDSIFEQPPYGAIEVNGGSATVDNITVNGATAFAVHAFEGASVTVSNSAFYDTFYSAVNEDGSVSDGFAVWGESGAALVTSGNSFNNDFVGIFANEASLVSTDDTFVDGYYGIQSILGAMDVSGASVTNPLIGGIYHASTGTVPSIVDSVISGDPDLVDATGSYGIAFQADDAYTNGVDIDGFNLFGMLVVPWDQTIVADFQNMNLTNTGRSGLYLENTDSTLTNVTVTDHRLVSDPSELLDGYTVNLQYGAVVVADGVVSWDGGGVINSEFAGVLQLGGSLTAANITLDGNAWAGIFNFQGSLAVSGATVSNSTSIYRFSDEVAFTSAGVYSYAGSTTVDSSHFVDNRVTWFDKVITPSEDLPDAVTYSQANASQDIYSQSSPLLEVTNNTFENGSSGVYIYEGSNIVVSGNSWTDYNERPVYAYQPTTAVEMVDNTMENIGLYGIYGYFATLEIEGLHVSGQADYEYSTVYYDEAGKELERQESSYPYWSVYCYECDIELSDSSFTDTAYHSLYLFYGSIELYDVTVTRAAVTGGYDSYGAVYAYTPSEFYAVGLDIEQPTLGYGLYLAVYGDGSVIDLQDVNIDGAPRHGVYLTGSSSYEPPDFSMSGVSITNSGEYGIYSSYFQDADFTDLNISGSTLDGVYMSYSSGSIAGESNLDNNGSDGLYAASSDLSVTGTASFSGNGATGFTAFSSSLDIEGAIFAENVGDGLYAYNSDVSMYDSEASGNGGAGLALDLSTVVDVSQNIVTGNEGYGLECDVSTTVSVCDDNDLSGNTAGDLTGCEACGTVD